MPFSYVVYKDLYLVVSTGRDCVSWGEIRACQDQTHVDPDFNAEFDQIVDLHSVTRFVMTPGQARTLAQRKVFSITSKRAFVAPSPSVFGVGRMWEAFPELSDYPSQIGIFRSLPTALRWLGLKKLPASISSEPARIEAFALPTRSRDEFSLRLPAHNDVKA
jgi:hypothetical protein